MTPNARLFASIKDAFLSDNPDAIRQAVDFLTPAFVDELQDAIADMTEAEATEILADFS